MSRSLIVVGAGGHGRVVADALLSAGEQVLGFVDPDPALRDAIVLGLPVLGDDAALNSGHLAEALLVNGVGGVGGGVRRGIQERLEAAGRRFTGVRHPSAVISPFARVADDAQVLARGVVQANAEILRGGIVNTAAVVEHDCRLASFVHCAPGVVLCGGVSVGEDSHLGAGAIVRENVALGARTIVGGGAVVLRSQSDDVVLIGNPARVRI